jgi:two-component system, chemotaxis family, sensor kinase Cph1
MNSSASDAAALPWAGQPYSVKRFGVTITNCDTEPVHTPGCIQGHGALLVLRPLDLTILQASENTAALLGQAPEALLGQPVQTVLGLDGAARIRQFLTSELLECNPLYVFTRPGESGAAPLDVTLHTIDGVAIVELEATARTTGQQPEPDYFAIVKHSVARLQKAQTLQALGEVATQEIRALTGLDRVMVYKFHDDGHGEVVAESRRADLSSWLGMHYPAEDIPEPAREIFRQVWIRPVREVGSPLAEIVPLAHPETGKSLTMTYCVLRGPSVMYTEYLQNMGVTAGLTLSIRRGDKLWGLIAAHHYGGPAAVPYFTRAVCELVAQNVSLLHESAEGREHFAYRVQLQNAHQQLVAQAAHEGDLSAMVDGPSTLLDAMDADGAALFYADRWWRVGSTPADRELDALVQWLALRPELFATTQAVFATDALASVYPGGPALSGEASGLLAIALSRGRQSLVLWFRRETIRTVNWGGNPDDKPTKGGPNGPRLTPRRSFELFAQSVRGRSRPWKAVEIEMAARLRMLVMELIVSRAQQLAELNVDLSRSNEELDAFAYVASHDLKEPLRGIHKYAYQLSEDAGLANVQSRRRLDGLMRLTLRMDSLLDSLLHFSRVGRVSLEIENVDLNELVAEALEMVYARRSEKRTEIVIERRLPHAQCDRVRVREVFVNLLSNALKYNDKPVMRIEIGWYAPREAVANADWPAGATLRPIYYVKDNGLGIQPRHVDQVFKMFKRLHGREEFGGGTGAGLTIVKKLVERHGGTVWLDSEPGVGSTFYFTLLQPDA